MEFTRILSATGGAAFLARRALGEWSAELDPDLLQDAQLVATELVTNVVRHSGLTDPNTFELRGCLREGVLRLELRYDAPAFHFEVVTPDPSDETGRGLFIVDRLTTR